MSVTFTSTGSTFNPQATLVVGASTTLNWACPGFATQSTLNPSFSFGSSATRTVTLTTTPAGQFQKILALNFGYDGADTVGAPYTVPNSYLYTPAGGFGGTATQVVTAAGNLGVLTGMIYFLANYSAFNKKLDFTGCTALQIIELFQSSAVGVTLDKNMTSFQRLDAEQCNLLGNLNLNPVAGTIADVRAAQQASGTLQFTLMKEDLPSMQHLCIHDQTVLRTPSGARQPGLVQRWAWNTQQTGTIRSASTGMEQLKVAGNHYDDADVKSQFTTTPTSSAQNILDLSFNSLAHLDMTGNSKLQQISLQNNLFAQADVDSILTTISAWTPSGGGPYFVNIQQNEAPSAATISGAIATMVGNGWTVTYEPSTTAPSSPYSLMDGVNWRPGGTGSPPSYYGTPLPVAPSGGSGPLTVGHEFYVTEDGLSLDGYQFYATSDMVTGTTHVSFALWEITGGNAGGNPGVASGTYVTGSNISLASLSAGWNAVTLGTSIPLDSDTPYMAVVGFSGPHPITQYQFNFAETYHNGIDNDPLHAYSAPAGGNADPYGNFQGTYGAAGSYDPTTNLPTNNYNDSLYWVDVTVS